MRPGYCDQADHSSAAPQQNPVSLVGLARGRNCILIADDRVGGPSVRVRRHDAPCARDVGQPRVARPCSLARWKRVAASAAVDSSPPHAVCGAGRARRCRGRTPPAPTRGTPGELEHRPRDDCRSLGRYRPANTGCCSQRGRALWSRIIFCAAALQQNPVSLVGLVRGRNGRGGVDDRVGGQSVRMRRRGVPCVRDVGLPRVARARGLARWKRVAS
jgi:hypothetical protein